jgi:hypothetical protein
MGGLMAELKTYIFFYVDDYTDRSFEAYIEAHNYQEAEKKLRREYDVYHIISWDILD